MYDDVYNHTIECKGKAHFYHRVPISRTKRTVPNSNRTVQLLPAIFGHCPLGYEAQATNVASSNLSNINDKTVERRFFDERAYTLTNIKS